MEDSAWLATAFEQHRPRLTAIASRMLSSRTEADDAVQEAWMRFSRSDMSGIGNLGAWLTTVVSRVCLNVLQARRAQPGSSLDDDLADAAPAEGGCDPEREALLADSVGLALLVVLDSLTPGERVAFVLHDLFAVPFEEIAPIVGRSATTTRQLASRARRRVQHADPSSGPDRVRQSMLVDAFLAAARGGDFAALVAALDPDAILRCDAAAVALGGPAEARGAETVAAFARRARGVQPALVGGAPAGVGLARGELRLVLLFRFSEAGITSIDAVADPEHLAALDVLVLDATQS
jgi:RNA polymerase sigma-70 factor (ECF subfamily)